MESTAHNNVKRLHSSIIALLGASTLAISSVASAGWVKSSQVTDIVNDNQDGTWTYNFTVHNTSQFFENSAIGTEETPLIIDWELPYFSDMGITDVTSPDGWNWAYETIGVANPTTGWEGEAAWQDPNDPFYAGDNSPYTTGTQVLHWYCENLDGGEGLGCANNSGEGPFGDPIDPGNSLAGFSFVADFAPTNAPYQASWFLQPIQTGDPAFPFGGGVGSPMAVGNVPEPGSMTLLGLGLLGLYGVRRKKLAHKISL